MAQEQQILDWFLTNPLVPPTGPEYLHRAVFNQKVPLTSVRRALTRLKDSGKLVKSGNIVTSQWGRPINCWKLKGGK